MLLGEVALCSGYRQLSAVYTAVMSTMDGSDSLVNLVAMTAPGGVLLYVCNVKNG